MSNDLETPPFESLATSTGFATKLSKGWIYTIRKVLGLSQGEFAQLVNISENKIYNLERAESQNMLISKLISDIANKLDYEVEYIIKPMISFSPLYNSVQSQEMLKKIQDISLPEIPENGWIRTTRLQLGASQPYFAELIGAEQSQVYRAELREIQNRIFHKRYMDILLTIGFEIHYAFVPKEGEKNKDEEQTLLEVLDPFISVAAHYSFPQDGWIKTIRQALGLSKKNFARACHQLSQITIEAI